MNGFERRKEQKKESIRRAALELFKAYGTRKVSVKDIADKAGVSPVTIYNHFGSKQELVRDVIKWMASTNVEDYRAILESDQPFLERLERVLFEKSERLQLYHSDLVRTVLSEDPEIREFVDTLMQQEVNQLWLDFVEEGKRKGYVNPDLSPQAILFYLDMFLAMAYARPEVYTSLQNDPELLGGIWRFFLYGLMGKETGPDLLRSINGNREAGFIS